MTFTPNLAGAVKTEYWVALYPQFQFSYTDIEPYAACESNTPLSYFTNVDNTAAQVQLNLDPKYSIIPDDAYNPEHPEFLPFEAKDAIIGLVKGVPYLGSPFYLGFVGESMDVTWYGATGDYQIPDDPSVGAWSRGTALPVSWGDGTVTSPTATHTYSQAGLYQVYATTPYAPKTAITPTPMAMRWARVLYRDVPAGYSYKKDFFTRANSASLGNTDTGQPWQVDLGSAAGINSNRAYFAAGAGVSVNSYDAGLANGKHKFVFKAGNNGFVVVRMVDASTFLYIDSAGAVNRYYGGFAGTTAPFAATTAHQVEITRNGSTFTIKKDGSTVRTFTSSLFSSATKCGVMSMQHNGYAPSFNNFYVKDVTGTTTLINDNFSADTPSLIQTTPGVGPSWGAEPDNNNVNGAWEYLITGGVLTLNGGFDVTADPPVDMLAVSNCGASSYIAGVTIHNGYNGALVVAYQDYNNYIACDAEGNLYTKFNGSWLTTTVATGATAGADTTVEVILDGAQVTTYVNGVKAESRWFPEFITGTRAGLMANSPASNIYWGSIEYFPNPYDISYPIRLESAIESGVDTPVAVRFSIKDNTNAPYGAGVGGADLLQLKEQQGMAIFAQEYRDGSAYSHPKVVAAGFISNRSIEYHPEGNIYSGVIYGAGYWLSKIDMRDHSFNDISLMAGYVLGMWEGSGQPYTWNATSDPTKAEQRIKYPDPTPDPFAYDPYSTGYIASHWMKVHAPYVAAKILNGLTIQTLAPNVNTPLYHPYIPPPSQDHHRADSVPTYDPVVVAEGGVPPLQMTNSDWRDFSKFTTPPGFKWSEGLTVSPALYAYGSLAQFTDVYVDSNFDEMEGRYYLEYLLDNGVSNATANQKIQGSFASYDVPAGKILPNVKQVLDSEAYIYYDRMDGTQRITRKYPYNLSGLPTTKGDIATWTQLGEGAQVLPGEFKYVKQVQVERPITSALMPGGTSWTGMHDVSVGGAPLTGDVSLYKQSILFYHAVVLQHKAYGDAHWDPKVKTRSTNTPISALKMGARPGTDVDAVKLLTFGGIAELINDPLKNTTDPPDPNLFYKYYPAKGSERPLGSVISRKAIYTMDVSTYAQGADREERRHIMIHVPFGNYLDLDLGDIVTVTHSGTVPFQFSWSGKKFEVVNISFKVFEHGVVSREIDMLEIDPDEGTIDQ